MLYYPVVWQFRSWRLGSEANGWRCLFPSLGQGRQPNELVVRAGMIGGRALEHLFQGPGQGLLRDAGFGFAHEAGGDKARRRGGAGGTDTWPWSRAGWRMGSKPKLSGVG